MLRVLRAAERRAMPWRNGGGVTHELAVHPPGAGMDDFLWRLSMAEVTQPGPFSRFTGIDRVLAVLDGRLVLSGARIGTVPLTPASTPFPFAGEDDVAGEPSDGPVLDLNAMVRRDRFTTEMRRLAPGSHPIGQGTAILVALGPVRCSVDGEVATLARLDCLHMDAPLAIDLEGEAGALLVRFTACGVG